SISTPYDSTLFAINSAVLTTLEELLHLVSHALGDPFRESRGESRSELLDGPTSSTWQPAIQVELIENQSVEPLPTKPLVEGVKGELTEPPPGMQLTVRVQCSDQVQREAIARIPDLVYLQEAFQCLTNGLVAQTEDDTGIQWQFQWALTAS
ncbi:MAG: hypothetical protein F6K09_27345, partial [Merismopedia sp. SIO2A8]|nr:hypothetical protein [Merismopedia sp. SIO2A8]